MHTDKDKQLESSPSEGSSRAQSQQKTPGQALTRCSCIPSLFFDGPSLTTFFLKASTPSEGVQATCPRVLSPGEGNANALQYSCLRNPMDCSPPGSSVCGTSQARILEWVATRSCRGSSRLRDGAGISCLAGRFFTTEPLGDNLQMCSPLVRSVKVFLLLLLSHFSRV